MSHEGIRIMSVVNRRLSRNGCLPDAAIPLKVRVKKTEGTGVEVDWKDGHRQRMWNFPVAAECMPVCDLPRSTRGGWPAAGRGED